MPQPQNRTWDGTYQGLHVTGGNAVNGWYSNEGVNIRTVDPNYQLNNEISAMYEAMAAAMERQAMMQADYMAQMSALQEEQMRMQEEQAKAAQVESGKKASDFAPANADDTARKQLLRRGLMSTFTRYDKANPGQGGAPAKSAKLGG